jgi:hypothetical protein
MPRKGNELPRTKEDLDTPPLSDPSDWSQGAMSVASFCSTFDVGRCTAFEAMKAGKLVWGRMGRQRRISRRSATNLFANESES